MQGANPTSLREYLLNHLRGDDADEFLVEALVLEDQLVVVDAEAIKDGRVEVAHVDGVLDDVVGEFVGFTEGHAALNAGPSHPHTEITRVVVAAVISLGERALRVDGAAEFAAPDD